MARKLEMWHLCYIIFPAFVSLHHYIAPYTKVEESFNMQATHDILTYGVPMDNVYLRLKAHYDHMTFAGAVPRTFVGSLVLAALARPFVWVSALNGEEQQFLGKWSNSLGKCFLSSLSLD
jgi:alpha-1,6-mannosyltransferase